MAIRVSVTGGNWSDATTWQTITATSTQGSGNLNLANTRRYGQVFTAPNTTNACLGAVFYWANASVLKTVTIYAVLQEYNGSAWVDVASGSVLETNMKYDNLAATGSSILSSVYVAMSTPYTFTTTTAGYYRFAFYSNNANQITARYDSVSTSTIWYACIDDRTGAIGTTDEAWIIGNSNSGYTTVTLSGAISAGNNTTIANVPSSNVLDCGVLVSCYGHLSFDNTINSSLTIKGHTYFANGSKLTMGTEANPLPAGITNEIIFVGNTEAVTPMIILTNYRADTNFQLVGATKVQQSQFVSGVGTAASPLITSTVTDWNVGDEIAISGSAYNTWEKRFIITKNSSTSYVLSTTVGGAEVALANTHYVTDYIINVTRNVKIRATDPAKPWAGFVYCYSSHGNLFDYVELKYMGGTTSGRYNFTISSSARYGCRLNHISIVPATNSYYGIYSYSSSSQNLRICDVVGYYDTTAQSNGIIYLANYAGTHDNFYLIGGYNRQANFGGVNRTYRNVYSFNGQRRSASGTYNYMALACTGINCNFINLNVNSSRSNAIQCTGTNLYFKDSSFGTVYSNVSDINPGYAGSFTQAIFDNCTFGSPSLWSSALTDENNSIYQCTASSYIRFVNIAGNLADSQGYYPEGNIYSTGAGLTDTTVRTVGGYPMRFRSEYGDVNLEFKQDIPTGNILGKTMSVGVWVHIAGSAFWAGNYIMPRLTVIYDNGTEAYAEAAQVAGSWQLLQVPFTPATAYGLLNITFSCASDTTGGDEYVYVTDWSVLYPAGAQLDLGKQSVWARGLPVVPTIATNLSAADVWATPTTTLTGSGTVGKLVVDTKDKVDVVEIKADDAFIGGIL